jgi:hypothetical protein
MCVPGHDSTNGTTFFTIVVYDKQKTSWMTQATWSTLVDCLQAEDNLLMWSGHLDHPLGRFYY